MKKLNVNFDEIQKAMEDISRDSFDYYLDKETGEIIMLSEEVLNEAKARLYDDELDEIDEDIEYIEYDVVPDIPDWMLDEIDLAIEVLLDESGRYIRIPERNSDKAFQTMVMYVGKVNDMALKEKLSHALNGRGSFRKFKDILLNFPKERKRWHGFNAKVMKKEIAEWLNSVGVDFNP
jgi:hypothetical protein